MQTGNRRTLTTIKAEVSVLVATRVHSKPQFRATQLQAKIQPHTWRPITIAPAATFRQVIGQPQSSTTLPQRLLVSPVTMAQRKKAALYSPPKALTTSHQELIAKVAIAGPIFGLRNLIMPTLMAKPARAAIMACALQVKIKTI